MSTQSRPANVLTLHEALPVAEAAGYALGSFSPRYLAMLHPTLQAAEAARSPIIAQIGGVEFRHYGVSPTAFATEFYRLVSELGITVPVVLHLDHTKDLATIEEAIAAGFTSVMIDASELPLTENIARTKAVVALAGRHGVSVEAELGRISSTDTVESSESGDDTELYTDPEEARRFVAETGVDALAVSVGTAHGVYLVKEPTIDFARLAAIRALTPVHLVLHGGSGVPAAMVADAIALPGGGVSKVNIATDLEQAALAALGRTERLTSAAMSALPAAEIARAQAAVAAVVDDKLRNFLGSAGQADAAAWRTARTSGR
jgi:ketose-bisphosphate aldolase